MRDDSAKPRRWPTASRCMPLHAGSTTACSACAPSPPPTSACRSPPAAARTARRWSSGTAARGPTRSGPCDEGHIISTIVYFVCCCCAGVGAGAAVGYALPPFSLPVAYVAPVCTPLDWPFFGPGALHYLCHTSSATRMRQLRRAACRLRLVTSAKTTSAKTTSTSTQAQLNVERGWHAYLGSSLNVE